MLLLLCIAQSSQPRLECSCWAENTFAMLKGEEDPASFAGQDLEVTGLQKSLAGELHLLLVAASKDGCLQSLKGCGFAVLTELESACRDCQAKVEPQSYCVTDRSILAKAILYTGKHAPHHDCNVQQTACKAEITWAALLWLIMACTLTVLSLRLLVLVLVLVLMLMLLLTMLVLVLLLMLPPCFGLLHTGMLKYGP